MLIFKQIEGGRFLVGASEQVHADEEFSVVHADFGYRTADTGSALFCIEHLDNSEDFRISPTSNQFMPDRAVAVKPCPQLEAFRSSE